MIAAIKYFHSKGITHRDLKTDNIMICGTESGDIQQLQVKMIDFGMSKFSKGGKVNLSTYCGTINFMAPEVVNGDTYDSECDLWSVGVIAFYMLAGEMPFLGKDEHAVA